MAGLTELDELQEICKAEVGAAGGNADKGIGWRQAGPSERQRANVLVILAEHEVDAPEAPGMADTQDLKASSEPGVKGMGYREELCSIRLTGCG